LARFIKLEFLREGLAITLAAQIFTLPTLLINLLTPASVTSSTL